MGRPKASLRKTPKVTNPNALRYPTLRAINWHLWLNNGELRVMKESTESGCKRRYGVFWNRFKEEQEVPDVGPFTREIMILWAHRNLDIQDPTLEFS